MKELLYRFIKDSIVFESIPPFSDNTRAVYDEMVRRGYDKKYMLVWYIDDETCATLKDGVPEYWNPVKRKTLKEKIRNYSYFLKTKCIICCNKFLPSSGYKSITEGEGQLSFYLSHGSPMKSVKEYYKAPEEIDYALAPAECMVEIMADDFSIDPKKFFVAGFPRNDVLTKPPIDLRKVLEVRHSNIIIWYPTYRQNDTGTVITTKNALPILHDEEKAVALNNAAKENDVLIILKPHFRQDTSRIKDLHLSNILFIDDSLFSQKGFSSYEMLAASDALITDYSSVYFDYTLVDKPIGVIWEDIDEYREYPGFALDLDFYLKGAEKIYTIDELCAFVKDVAAGVDNLQTERREIRDLVNNSTDGKNSERVVDFIAEKAKL